jgi:uncharacterized protein YjcR
MAKKSKYDWEAIEKLYRAGKLSVRQIAKIHGCSDTAIHKRARKHGWAQDLTEKINQKARNDLVWAEVCISNRVPEKEIVDQAAATIVEVVRSQRIDIKRGRESVALLLDQLQTAALSRDELEEFILEQTKTDKSPKRRNTMLKLISLPSHASVVNQLSNAIKNFIGLERQAFGLNDDGGDGGDPEKGYEINVGFVSTQWDGDSQ